MSSSKPSKRANRATTIGPLLRVNGPGPGRMPCERSMRPRICPEGRCVKSLSAWERLNLEGWLTWRQELPGPLISERLSDGAFLRRGRCCDYPSTGSWCVRRSMTKKSTATPSKRRGRIDG